MTKQMNGQEAARYRKILNVGFPHPPVAITPGGKPRPGENVAENVTSKFAQIKPRGGQVDKCDRSVLWLDLQDEDWWVLAAHHLLPLAIGGGICYSGPIWQAFFSAIGDPSIEHHTWLPLRFNGMWKQKTRFDAAVLAFVWSDVKK